MSILGLIVLSFQVITGPILGADMLTDHYKTNVEDQNFIEWVDYESSFQIHFNYYYELLVEKHRPDLLEDWQQMVREREAINKKLKDFDNEKQEELYEQISEDWYHKHELLQEHFLAAVKDREKEKIKKNIPHILTLKKSWNSEMREAIKEF
ncbi:hypothetical protein [Salipaludibacillus daqingensis]|uniref:hypothetical protein n=1 Tax=Salipaludibacillus daqingensis TaxID=3041001 RepID=UPI00247595C1|nr:hypothetical protein [Salipaludibacillus daqingensis]